LNLSYPELSQKGADLTQEDGDYTFFCKSHFHRLLRIERQRTERSRKPFLLALLDISNVVAGKHDQENLEKIKSALASALRETDIQGWYDYNRIIGVIFTEMASLVGPSIEGVSRKIHERFSEKLDLELLEKISISFHIYPEMTGQISTDGLFDTTLYPDFKDKEKALGKHACLAVKKAIDITGSAVLVLLSSPLFLIITAAIKLTSEGPVFFRQERLGYNSKTFLVLKFRSMYTNCDPVKHKEYITKYIGEQKNSAVEPGVFKLTNDHRVTPVGRWLRKTSLDELPQLINVLKGDMSLVGPRPPIPYECDLYDIWHRRRLLACKPGITGLWQVMGRSRTTFDEMVRLDLKYISEWSLWLDLKILLRTPKAVFSGKGAY
jgi:lipopolysaccharide/colanic/teichoic acid biosynthesis glycosyltransferase